MNKKNFSLLPFLVFKYVQSIYNKFAFSLNVNLNKNQLNQTFKPS